MFAPETAETTRFKHCQVCSAAQIDLDKFCRRCGASQSRRVEPINCITGSAADAVAGLADRSVCETARLSGSGSLRRSYSGRLVGIVTQELSKQTSRCGADRWAKLLISMLVAAPLWLMIVLLSPLDAYVAAKNLAKQL
jgi:hypothetical protein